VGSVVDILQNKLRGRISPDIYRGLVLESSQRMVIEHLMLIAEEAQALGLSNIIEVLLIVHANMMIINKELLGIEGSGEVPTLAKIGSNEDNGEDEELDLGKTGENLWQLITLSGPSAQYESVL
jgi:hypothetical protein